MANEPQISGSRKAEIAGLIVSDAPDDLAQLATVAAELLAEVERCHLRIASQDAHLAAVSRALEVHTTVESGAVQN